MGDPENTMSLSKFESCLRPTIARINALVPWSVVNEELKHTIAQWKHLENG